MSGIASDTVPLTIEQQFQAGRLAERADALAYLRHRRDVVGSVGQRAPELAAQSREFQRQIEVEIADIEGGMHVGEFETEARRHAREEARNG